MPQRTRRMHDESVHVPLATGSAVMVYGWTLETVVLALWATYVLILIAIKLPDLIGKYPFIGRLWRKLWGKK